MAEKTTPEEMESNIFYLSAGTFNQDYRGKRMDGEALVVVSSSSAMAAYLDFFNLMGLTTWVGTVEQVQELMPRFGGFWYKIGRYIKKAL